MRWLAVPVLVLALPASAFGAYDPPAWWDEGRALLEARGASCEPYSHTHMLTVQRPGDPEPRTYTIVSEGETCRHAIPRQVAGAFGSNPDRPAEVCGWSSETGGPDGDFTGATCGIFPDNVGTSARPNLVTWQCLRGVSNPPDPDEEDATDPDRWTAVPPRRGAVFAQRRVATLTQCLAPRAALRDGRTLRVTCSHACTVSASVGGARTRKRLGTGKSATLRPRGSGRLTVRVTAGRRTGRARGTVRNGRVNAPAEVRLR